MIQMVLTGMLFSMVLLFAPAPAVAAAIVPGCPPLMWCNGPASTPTDPFPLGMEIWACYDGRVPGSPPMDAKTCIDALGQGSFGCFCETVRLPPFPPVDPGSQSGLTPEQKARLEKAAEVFQKTGSITAGLLALCGGLPGPYKATCTSLLTQLTGFQGVIAGLLRLLALDPPDPNFTEIAPVVPATFTPVAQTCSRLLPSRCLLTAEEASDANALLENEALTIGILQAMVTTANRGSTAAESGDAHSFDRQASAFLGLQAWASALFADEAALRVVLGGHFAPRSGFAQALNDPAIRSVLDETARVLVPTELAHP